MTAERETLEVDVLFVGAGPACLAGAYHLGRLLERQKASVPHGGRSLGEISIAVLEKGAEVGAHSLSGAVLDPRALAELMPDYREQGAPLAAPVTSEAVLFLTERGKIPIPFVPPPLQNHGNFVISLGSFTRWLAEKVEAQGTYLLTGTPAARPIFDDGRLAGVRTGDKGVGRDGRHKPNFEPGTDVRARATVFGEGPRGSLHKELSQRLGLGNPDHPQIYGIGVKELWEIPAGRFAKGRVVHTMGYPLGSKTYGGGFVYGMDDTKISLGLVVGLDSADPYLDGHRETQRWKEHPWLRSILSGGRLLGYGAKSIPLGGYYAMSRLAVDGGLFVGDSAGFLNAQRLKGIHLAMKSGMLAAEAIFEGLVRNDLSARILQGYDSRLAASWARRELWRGRNFHQGFENGLWPGMLATGVQVLTGGWAPYQGRPTRAGHERMRKLAELYPGVTPPPPPAKKYDGTLTMDKLTELYRSGTSHEEDQPVHLLVADKNICATRCREEFGNPCQHFCPANVYEMVPAEGGGVRLQINAANCVHCKTCDILDPYQIIQWVTPEGGGGPKYKEL